MQFHLRRQIQLSVHSTGEQQLNDEFMRLRIFIE